MIERSLDITGKLRLFPHEGGLVWTIHVLPNPRDDWKTQTVFVPENDLADLIAAMLGVELEWREDVKVPDVTVRCRIEVVDD